MLVLHLHPIHSRPVAIMYQQYTIKKTMKKNRTIRLKKNLKKRTHREMISCWIFVSLSLSQKKKWTSFKWSKCIWSVWHIMMNKHLNVCEKVKVKHVPHEIQDVVLWTEKKILRVNAQYITTDIWWFFFFFFVRMY